MLAEWNDSFSVGIAEIDRQHRILFDLINHLQDGISRNRRREALGVALEGLMEYTAEHFKTEEDLMRKHGYPDLGRHTTEHNGMVDKIVAFKKRFDEGKEDLTLEVLMELIEWLHTHLGESDSQYKSFFHALGVR